MEVLRAAVCIPGRLAVFMADLSTVVTSVSVTLAFQGAYYLIVRYPYNLHKTAAELSRLRRLNDTVQVIFNRIRSEIEASDGLLKTWSEGINSIGPQVDPLKVNREYFREVLPTVTTMTGRLKGIASALDVTGINDVLTEQISLYEITRRITRMLAYPEECDGWNYSSDLSDFVLAHHVVAARKEQMTEEMLLHRQQWDLDFEAAQAELNDIRLRVNLSTLAVVAALMIGAFLLAGLNPRLNHFISPTKFTCFIGLLSFILFRLLRVSPYRKLSHLLKLSPPDAGQPVSSTQMP